ncbi:hypothetical protein D3C75_1125870 [compost metagenome]
MEDVAADQAEAPLQIARPQGQPPHHRGLKPRRMGLDRLDHQIGHRVAMRVRQIRRDMLAEQAGDMLARRRQTVVQGRGDQHLDDGL